MRNSPTQNDKGLVARLYQFAAFIAVIIALAPPLGFFWMSYQFQENELSIESKLHAAFITQIIIANPDGWKNDAQDLIEQELTTSQLKELRSVSETDGTLIAQTGASLTWPVLTRSSQLNDSKGVLLGTVNIGRSLVPILKQAGFVALGGISLGFAIFMILYTLPLRALNRTLTALHQEKQNALENEERLQIVIDNADEGIITLNAEGQVESFNAAAEHIFGFSAAEIIGRSAAVFISPTSDMSGNKPVPEYLQAGHHEINGIHKQGLTFPIEIAVSTALMKGISQFVCIVRNITERKQAQEKLSHMANFDNLTNLPNRNLFKDRLTQALHRAQRNNTLVALMFLDLDRFKTINDTLGHDAGDKLLQHVANILQNAVRKSDSVLRSDNENNNHTVSRLGGDEFTIILEGLNNAEGAAIAAQNILTAFALPVTLNGQEIYASTSIGIALYPVDDTEQDKLIKDADTAMYRAKEMGRNNFQFYTKDLNAQVNDRLTLETELRRAIERNEFVLHYQPKMITSNKEIVGVEALIRWQHPDRGLIPPDSFIPILEETGLIVSVGEWVLRTACEQHVKWIKAGKNPLTIAVNLSARQFMQKDLITTITRILKDTRMEPSFLEFELTESLLMQHTDYNMSTLTELSKMGIRISIDDFGTGYSSFAYLKRFAIDTLKIDRSFINELTSGLDDVAIVSAVIALANSLKLTVVAEGVETQEQLDMLRTLGCHQVQGYFLGRPAPEHPVSK